MARVKPFNPDRPLEGLSDKQLAERIHRAERALDKAEAAATTLDGRDVLAGKGAEPLARMDSG
jgi:hypothetical protein